MDYISDLSTSLTGVAIKHNDKVKAKSIKLHKKTSAKRLDNGLTDHKSSSKI